MSFVLHPKLAEDCIIVADLPVCRVLLMNNSLFPWIILVPRRAKMREIFDLNNTDYAEVMQEVRYMTKEFGDALKAYKMNVAALGNMVEQLHIHIIARYPQDNAWPNPVWNTHISPEKYAESTAKQRFSEVNAIVDRYITKM